MQVKVPVCKTCNNGWMSDLETTASPLIKAMASGAVSRGGGSPIPDGMRGVLGIEGRGQRTLAAWTAKTAAMLTLAHAQGAIPKPHTEAIRTTGVPAQGTWVLIGRYKRGKWGQLWWSHAPLPPIHQILRQPPPEPQTSGQPPMEHGYCTTLIVGELVLQAIFIGGDVPLNMHLTSSPYLLPIWTVQQDPAVWPPALDITDLILEGIAPPTLAPTIGEWGRLP
jgi:hypothetical protein